MLSEKLKNNTAIIDSSGKTFTFGDLNFNINRVSNILTVIEPLQVGIHCNSEFQAITAITACINTAINFIILPTQESNENYMARCHMGTIDLMISDTIIDDNIITFNPLTGIETKGGIAADILGTPEYLYNLTEKVKTVMQCDNPAEIYTDSDTRKQATHICFHKGICLDGFKFSGFTLDKLEKGIEKAQSLYRHTDGNTVLFLERIDLLYDIVNGILAPLEKGMKVVFTNTYSYTTLLNSLNNWAENIYSSATTLENLLILLEGEIPPFFKQTGSWVKKQYLKKIISNYFNSSVKHLIITGKINRLDLINLLDKPVTVLYTMCEIASFVSFKRNINKLTSTTSVGKINREYIHVINNSNTEDHGGILVYTEDMAISTNASFTEESFFHRFPGRLWTKDVGYVNSHHELHIINKTNLVFEEYNGKLVPTGKIIEFALSKPFIKKALLVSTTKTKLTLLIEPDLDWANTKKVTLADLEFNCRDLSSELYVHFKACYPIETVLYTDRDGIDDQLFKILIRR